MARDRKTGQSRRVVGIAGPLARIPGCVPRRAVHPRGYQLLIHATAILNIDESS